MSTPAVSVALPYQQEQRRLTTFFRLPLAYIPLIWLNLWSILTFFAVVFAWFALLSTGRYPQSLYAICSGWARYDAKVYGYFYLVTDRWPGFSADDPQDYPVRLTIGEPLAAYDRTKVLFRMLLAIPPALIAYAMSLVASVGAFLGWFCIVFTGRLPESIHQITRLGLSYRVRVIPYFLLMTETWPGFTDDGSGAALGSGDARGSVTAPPVAPSPFGESPQAELPGGFEPPTG